MKQCHVRSNSQNSFRLFQKTATGITLIFLFTLLFATVIAFSRSSGATKQDMAKAHLIRSSALADN